MIAMYDNAEHVAVTLTLWESDAAADEAAIALRAVALTAFDDLLLEPPTIKKYELLLSEFRRGE